MGFCCDGFGWGNWGGLGTAGLILNILLFVGILVTLGLGAVWLARQLGRRPIAAGSTADPLELARRRLAAGEITVAEFEEIQDLLRRRT